MPGVLEERCPRQSHQGPDKPRGAPERPLLLAGAPAAACGIGWGKFDQDRCLISDFREDALAGCAAPKLHDLQFLLARAAAGGLGLDEVGVVLGAEGGAEGREALNGFVIEERRTLSHRR